MSHSCLKNVLAGRGFLRQFLVTSNLAASAAKGSDTYLWTTIQLQQKLTYSSTNTSSSQAPPDYDAETKRKILSYNARQAQAREQLAMKVNRLLYRSKQRGFLEMDLLLGLWAKEHVPQASEPLLAAFEGMLDLENPDLFKWLTGQEQPPQELESNMAFQEVKKDIGSQLRGIGDSPAKTQPGREWLRGWDDWKKEQPEAISDAELSKQ